MVNRVGRILVAGAALWVVAAAVPAAAQSVADRAVTFTRDIAPILQRSCQNCHRPDSIAPMSLLTYAQARPYARAMKQRTALARSQYGRGAMPPWYLEKNIGVQKMKDDISLSDEEIAMVATWADSGAPQGNPADMPPPRVFSSSREWTLGKPDLIVTSPTVTVEGIGPDWWGNPWEPQEIPGVTEERFIRSAEYKEVSESANNQRAAGGTVGSLFVIHHTTAGIAGDVEGVGDGGGGLPTHEVGRNGDVFPEDAGKRVVPGSKVAWGNVHVHPSGVAGNDRNAHLDLGFKLFPKGYRPKYDVRAIGMGRSELEINANEGNQKVETYWVAPQPLRLLNFEPHLHSAGVRMCLEAIYQRSIETINCAGYDHNWVKNYQYDDNSAPLLPKGTILKATAYFDQTAKNANVIEPRNQANWGRRSVVNMFIVFEQAIYLTDEQYQEELAKRRQHLDATQTWDTLVGCPACFERPAAAPGAGGSQ